MNTHVLTERLLGKIAAVYDSESAAVAARSQLLEKVGSRDGQARCADPRRRAQRPSRHAQALAAGERHIVRGSGQHGGGTDSHQLARAGGTAAIAAPGEPSGAVTIFEFSEAFRVGNRGFLQCRREAPASTAQVSR